MSWKVLSKLLCNFQSPIFVCKCLVDVPPYYVSNRSITNGIDQLRRAFTQVAGAPESIIHQPSVFLRVGDS